MTSPKPSRTSLPLRRRGRAPHPNPLPRRAGFYRRGRRGS